MRSSTFGGGAITAGQLSCVESDCDPTATSTVDLRTSLFDRNHVVGIVISASTGKVDQCLVRDTMASAGDGLYGNGIAVFGYGTPGVASNGSGTCSAIRLAAGDHRGSAARRRAALGRSRT